MDENKITHFPSHVLGPVNQFLRDQLKKLIRTQKVVKKEDPFNVPNRTSEKAAPDEEAEEQVGHIRAVATQISISRRIIQTRRALSQIKIGKYGICENCGNMIDTERLVIYPEATLCVKCEKKMEKKK